MQFLEVGEALRESEARLRALLSSLDDLVFELDRDGTYLGVWTTSDELLVAPRSELLGRNIGEFMGEDLAVELIRSIRRVLKTGEPHVIEYPLDVEAGTRWFEGRIAPIIGQEGPRTVCFLARDVTGTKLVEQARADAEARLRHQALHDGLTGLPNRTHFHEHLEQELWKRRRTHDGLAVLMLDLDRFKEINDTLGHAAGDLVLQEVARRLPSVTREGDLIARLGGDEFALLLQHSSDKDAASVALRVRRCVEDSVDVDGVLLNVDISTGIAVYPLDGCDADSLLRRADVAMYVAKRRNAGIAPYDRSLDHHEPDQLALVGELRGALERDELVLYYQPVLDLSTGAVRKVEALVRWLHPERGLLSPDQFIPLVRESAIVTSLTRCVLDQALAQCRRWLDGGRELGVAVNVSMRDLIDVAFPDEVAELLSAHGLSPDRLSLEITERSVMADPRRTILILDRLSEMGVHLSIDDFGTGYSSLTYLIRLPVDEVKIDRSFVTNMTSMPDEEAVVRSTVELAKSLHKVVVAEGVETLQVLSRLKDLGCDAAQGFYMSRPLPADELDRWLSSR